MNWSSTAHIWSVIVIFIIFIFPFDPLSGAYSIIKYNWRRLRISFDYQDKFVSNSQHISLSYVTMLTYHNPEL